MNKRAIPAASACLLVAAGVGATVAGHQDVTEALLKSVGIIGLLGMAASLAFSRPDAKES